MTDLYFFNSPYGNPFVVKGSWPESVRQMWIDAMAESGISAADPGLVPTFEEGNTVNTGGVLTPLNPEYFATAETADAIMKRFGADHVALIPYPGADQVVNFSDAKERWIVFRNGTAINAGKLATFFKNNPELQFPHVAENAAWRAIADSQGQKLPVPIVAVKI